MRIQPVRSKRIYPVALAALCACTVAASCGEDVPPRDESPDPSFLSFAEETWPEDVDGAIAVTRGEDDFFCVGLGAGSCDNIYDVGSVTKGFTGAAVAKLADEGALSLDDPIARHLNDVPGDKREITIEQLLTHTSGLPDSLGDDYEPLTREQMLREAMAVKLEARPGVRHRYSNLGYSVLAAIIEEASGMSYEEYLREALFEPAGMTQTGYVLPDWDEDAIAHEFDEGGRDHGTPLDHPWAEDGPYWNLRGNGGLLSTPGDMGRWLAALAGDEVLSEEAKTELFAPRVLESPNADSRYGFGWVTSPTPLGRLVWHDGSNDLSFAVIGRFLEPGVGVFAVSNNAYSRRGPGLPDRAQELALGIAERASDGG